MSLDRIRWAVATGAATGLVISVIFMVLFGILDVQCWDNPDGDNWDSELQTCS